jgi:hypothetical protein
VIANQTAAAVQSAPSTRAAVEVMAAALTQQQAQAMAQQAAIAARLDALITQQTQLASLLSDTVAGLATTTGLLSQQLTQQLETEAQGNMTSQDATAGAVSGLAGELSFLTQGGDPAGFGQFLTTSVSAP